MLSKLEESQTQQEDLWGNNNPSQLRHETVQRCWLGERYLTLVSQEVLPPCKHHVLRLLHLCQHRTRLSDVNDDLAIS